MFEIKFHQLISILLLYLSTLSFCLEQSSILLLPFKTKSLQKEEDDEDWVEPYQSDEEGEWPYVPPSQVFNSSEFINKWFYNGLNVLTKINNYNIESYVNMDNSKLSLEKCNPKKIISSNRGSNIYKPLNSNTYTKKGDNIGNDVFYFIGDLHYKSTIKIGEKGNGLNFFFNEKDNNEDLCANLGLNIDTNLDQTNIITQLKKKNYINEYIWTLKYLVEDDGIIVLGTQPHYYENNTYLMSQYCELNAIPNQSPETAWSFNIDEIRIKPKESNNIILSNAKIDLLVDRGLIIGTNEYKNKIDELVFNDLINKKICFREETNFKDEEKGLNEIYIVYYCDRKLFIGNKYTMQKSPFNSFPYLEFYLKEKNMTFTLTNDNLFHEIYNRSYFLVTFKKSENNNIWKLGEPFLSHYQITFDQDKKLIGFYNPSMPKISNEDYIKEREKEQNENNQKSDKNKIIIIVVVCVIGAIGLSIGAYFLGKKLNEIRKRRANELKDDFDYTTTEKINDNKEGENNNENDVLGIQKD